MQALPKLCSNFVQRIDMSPSKTITLQHERVGRKEALQLYIHLILDDSEILAKQPAVCDSNPTTWLVLAMLSIVA